MKQLIFAAMAIFAAACLSAQQYTVTFLLGDVSVKRAGMTSFIPVKVNDKLLPGDTVKSAKASFAQISSVEPKFVVRLSEDTEFNLSTASSSQKKLSFNLVKGKIWSKVEKMATGNSMEFSTPASIAAVRGTIFILSFENGTARLFTVQGEMGFGKDALALVTVKGGLIAGVGSDGKIDPPRAITDAERKKVMDGVPVFIKQGSDDRGTLRNEVNTEVNRTAQVRTRVSETRSTDMTAGRTLKDINGNVVRVEQIIKRPDPRTITLINLTKRDTGLDYFQVSTVFTKDLPKSIMDIVNSGAAPDIRLDQNTMQLGSVKADGRRELKYWTGNYNETTQKYEEAITIIDPVTGAQTRAGKLSDIKGVSAPEYSGKAAAKMEWQLWAAGQYGIAGQEKEKVVFNMYAINNEGQIIGTGGITVSEGADVFAIIKSIAGQVVVTYNDLARGTITVSDVVIIPDIVLVFIQGMI
ncbi:MAG: FecR domain-containing protein [Spirochaetes bacterium]|nr:FecR domain-containing protein [Spirochaetota bacterium]